MKIQELQLRRIIRNQINEAYTEYAYTSINEVTTLSFRGNNISAENVIDNLQRYLNRLAAKFSNSSEVKIPVVKSTAALDNAFVADSSNTRLVGKSLIIKSAVAGNMVILNPKRVEWIVYELEGRRGPTWGAAIKGKNGQFIRADSLQKTGFFDTGKADVLQKQKFTRRRLG